MGRVRWVLISLHTVDILLILKAVQSMFSFTPTEFHQNQKSILMRHIQDRINALITLFQLTHQLSKHFLSIF